MKFKVDENLPVEVVTHLRTNRTRVDDLEIYARLALRPERSDAPPVILVHGWVVSSRYMLPTLACLASHYYVHAPDLPGFGKSSKPPQTFGVAPLADVLVRWMSAQGLEKASILANSFGCQIATDLAVRYQERVDRLVLVGPTVDPKARTYLQQFARLAWNALQEPPSLVAIFLRDLLAAGLKRALLTGHCALQDRIEERLPLVAAPTLVIRGEDDVLVPQQWATEVTRLLPDGRLAVVAGAAHAVNYNSSEELMRVVHPFLSGERAQ